MKKSYSFLLGLLALLLLCLSVAESTFADEKAAPRSESVQTAAASDAEMAKKSVNLINFITIDGTINPGSSDYLKTSIARAEANKATALIVELNTPGGLLSSTREIIQTMAKSKVPVVMYVTPGGASATSAGAIISIASHFAVMAPGTNIGAAHPVAGAGKDIEGDMGKKVTNDTAALVRSQATLHGRNAELAEKLVTESSSLSEEEAVKKKIVEAIAQDKQELVKILNGRTLIVAGEKVTMNTEGAKLQFIPMSTAQGFLHVIANPNISTILMALGGLAIYTEVSSGFSLIFPGAIGVILMVLAFISLQTLPINVGAVLLFLLGFVFIVAEAFITSFGLLSVLGLGSIVLGALFMIDPAGGNIAVSMNVLIPIVGSVGFILILLAYMFARDKSAKEDSFAVHEGSKGKVRNLKVGDREGQASIDGEIWHVRSEETLKVGDSVVVTGKDGLTLIVKKGE